ncbi:MAG TPA: hypothetical protein VLL48_02645, partial [Longimicrobiales bacterium]|nr:hypothetical protein [Longimicrobiales bacterium]
SVARPRGEGGEDGLTLGELQAIGREVGIAPDLVADAATALDRPRTGGIQRTWGLPLSVERTVDLPRQLTEDEWERLVTDLRTTFSARGKLDRHGRLRQWTNGNLHALLEPTADGHRLRLGTTKGTARSFLAMGIALLTMALVLSVLSVILGTGDTVRSSIVLAAFGLGGLGAGAIQLPGWARTRRAQMDAIAQRLAETVKALPEGAEGAEESGSGEG